MDASGFDWYASRETLNKLTDGEVIEAGQRACRDLPGYWGFYERFTEAAHRRKGG
jgi:hypothetical protein